MASQFYLSPNLEVLVLFSPPFSHPSTYSQLPNLAASNFKMSLDSVSLSQILCYVLKIGLIRSSLDCYCSSPIICSPITDSTIQILHIATASLRTKPLKSFSPQLSLMPLVSKLKPLDSSLPFVPWIRFHFHALHMHSRTP